MHSHCVMDLGLGKMACSKVNSGFKIKYNELTKLDCKINIGSRCKKLMG